MPIISPSDYWRRRESVEETETIAMGDRVKHYLGGLRDGSGQVDAFWYKTDVGRDELMTPFGAGTTVALHVNPTGLTATGNIDCTGDFIIKSVIISASKDDVIRIRFQFRGFLSKSTLT